MTLEKVKVYRSWFINSHEIYIHLGTTPVFNGVSTKQSRILPRLEVMRDRVCGFPGQHNSRMVEGEYPWIPKGVVVECYYDAEKGKLL